MSAHPRSILETRSGQMFPTLEPAELERLRRFGELQRYAAGERLVATGEVSPGLFVILAGEVAISQRSALGYEEAIVTHGPGSFMGELNQLSGRPSLVDANALTAVEAIVIPSSRLRDVLVAEAELGERIMRALILRRVGLLQSGVAGPLIVGRAGDGAALRLTGFLARNGQPHQTLDPDTDACARTLVERFHVEPAQLPIVLCPNGALLRNPTESEVARCIGIVRPIDPAALYDVAIIGAGPAGLAASVYAASEGLAVIVLDTRAFGGQAGASARIENYMGFPTGISGMALMARAFNQAEKFGAEMAIPDEVVRLRCGGPEARARFELDLANGERVRTRAVVIASGVRYRRIDVPNLAAFEGASVHYWATPIEGKLCAGEEVVLVGAGNSAGQAAVYLAGQVAKLWLLARGKSVEATMARYLVDRIAALPNVEVRVETEVTGLEGQGGALEAIRWRHAPSGKEERRPIRHLFLFIGADPHTAWLSPSDVALDAKGFVRTGMDLGAGHRPLETSRAGVFAIGDVRAGSVKRVAAAVGEGAQVVATLHRYLADA
ncbi:MAG TPA: FAD-dependent oxidoreductase [Myxococcota bacterium]|nr:FAD-dependent oxidoreductase [Myxococcota bacterium]